MANRDNHYEAAFEAYLRSRQIPYVAVDEARRSLAEHGSLKSLDFIVSPPDRGSWLVDVKGRRFPSGDEQKQYWKNWSPRDDLASLARWEQLFGNDFRGLLVFAYVLVADRSPVPPEKLFHFRTARYAFIAVRLADYVRYARPISTAWDTLAMPTGVFRDLARPIETFLQVGAAAAPTHDAQAELTAELAPHEAPR